MGKVYPEELKKKAVELYRLDEATTYAQVGRDLGGIPGETIRNWCRQADRDQGRLDDGGLTSDEKARLAELERDKLRLEKENRIKSGNGVLCAGPAVKYAWIDEMARKDLWWFSVALACELLEVSRSGFYDWRARQSRPTTARQREQQLLVAEITVAHIASCRRYGSPRIHADVVEAGWQVGVNRVARLMRLHGLEGRSGRVRRHNLTRQAKVAPHVPDLLERDFTAEVANVKWTTDITYVPTAHRWVYLAVLVDLCSKAVVGWSADTHMRTSLVIDALTMALQVRRPGPGLIVHSDRAAQYTSREWLDTLEQVDARASMGRVGVCWDNAPAESWFGGFKNELVHPIGAFVTIEEAKVAIARYIRWHNTTRRHSALQMLAPHTWERAHTLTRAA